MNFLKDKTFIILLTLFVLTLASWLMLYFNSIPASNEIQSFDQQTISAVLLFLAFIKVQLIISQYMELHKAIVPIRIVFWGWTIGVGAMCIFL